MPVVRLKSALEPVAVFWKPVVRLKSALSPPAVLLLGYSVEEPAALLAKKPAERERDENRQAEGVACFMTSSVCGCSQLRFGLVFIGCFHLFLVFLWVRLSFAIGSPTGTKFENFKG
jgi:hypothetical protein